MLSRIRRRLAGDAGISLVEMLIAIIVLGLILTGLATTLMASLVSLHSDELRVRSSQLANQVVEDLQAAPWHQVGFYEDDTGYQAEFDGEDTVTLGSERNGDPGPVPQRFIERSDVEYTVTTNITWVEVSGEGEARMKAFDVHLGWEERGSPRSHSVRAVRSPTPNEVAVDEEDEPDQFEITSFSVNPRPVPLQPPDNTAGEIKVRLRTSQPADSVVKPTLVIEGDDGEVSETWGSFEEDDSVEDAPEGTAWTLTIPPGDGQFTPGAYEFIAEAASATESDQAVETVWFVYPSDENMEIQEPTFEPGPFCRPNGGHKSTHFPVHVEFEVEGASGADSAKLLFEESGQEFSAEFTGLTDEGATFEAVVPEDTEIDKSQAHLVLHAYRQIDSQEATLAYAAAVESTNHAEDCSGAES